METRSYFRVRQIVFGTTVFITSGRVLNAQIRGEEISLLSRRDRGGSLCNGPEAAKSLAYLRK